MVLSPSPTLTMPLTQIAAFSPSPQVLVERLKNEITRLTAVKALAAVARSPLSLPLGAAMVPAMPELTSFLRKANRPLRQATLTTLQVRHRTMSSNDWQQLMPCWRMCMATSHAHSRIPYRSYRVLGLSW